MSSIEYQIKTASQEKIHLHLKECSDNFIPPLDQKVNISEYAKKIFENAITFEAWENQTLVGLVAAYFNDAKNNTGYVTNVSVTPAYKGKGVADKLMRTCISYAEEHDFLNIVLEVSKENHAAIKLYNKLKFVPFENNNNVIKMIFYT